MGVPDEVVVVAARFEEPVYVYDLDRVRDRLRALERMTAWPTEFCFATMANDHPEVLRTVCEEGHGVFVNSRRHLQAALDAGFQPEQVIYAATNLTPAEMTACTRLGIQIILDSLGQLTRYSQLPDRAPEVGLRVNVGSALDGQVLRHDPDYRFGILPEELPAALHVARKASVRVTGIHSYFGTDLMSPELLLVGLDRLAGIGATLPDVEYVDVGGGFGVTGVGPGPFDLGEYGCRAERILAAHSAVAGRAIRLVLEPGRFVCAECGYFLVRVMDLKIRADRVFVGTNGSIAQFPRPLFHPQTARHKCYLIGAGAERADYPLPIDVCGNSTFSRDFLARGLRMPLPEPGESLAFHPAGAYCRSMITDFLGKDRPREVVLPRRASLKPTPVLALAGG